MPDPNDRAHVTRRNLLLAGTSLGVGSALGGCESGSAPAVSPDPGVRSKRPTEPSGAADPILAVAKLGTPPWPTFDPFLFCVHHNDRYPVGNALLGPVASLEGRNIGQDFGGKDGWSMYHGDVVPGFPRHPHRGFETVTITRRGYVDHSDSLGATARYGEGDVQWMTAGRGIVHAEMFPLLDDQKPNPAELFQIWLNLPARSKFVPPHFSMFWQGNIPRKEFLDAAGHSTRVTVIAGSLEGLHAPAPPPDSWAAHPESDVAIWSLRMAPGARFTLPAVARGTQRTLYYFEGTGLRVADRELASGHLARLRAERSVTLESGSAESEVLLLAGRPIGEPVVQHGPFVMNQRSEIEQAILDYRNTQFGGWPWKTSDPVHVRESGRFAVHASGRKERGV
jgi:redox-sensitive bicupin YhaK (pirin superfamily)